MDSRYCPSAWMRWGGDLIRIGDCRDFTRRGICRDESVPSDELQHPVFEPSPLESGYHLLATSLSFPGADEGLRFRSRVGVPSRPGSFWAASATTRRNERKEDDN